MSRSLDEQIEDLSALYAEQVREANELLEPARAAMKLYSQARDAAWATNDRLLNARHQRDLLCGTDTVPAAVDD